MKNVNRVLTIALTLVLFATVNTFANKGKIVSVFPNGNIADVELEDGSIVKAIDKGGQFNLTVGANVEVELMNYQNNGKGNAFGQGNGNAPQAVVTKYCLTITCD